MEVFPIFFEALGFDNRTSQNNKERLDVRSDIRIRFIRQKLGFFISTWRVNPQKSQGLPAIFWKLSENGYTGP